MEKLDTMERFRMEAEKMEDGFVFAMLTDQIIWKQWPLNREERKDLWQKEKNLLDIRIFNKDKELRMFRGNVGRAFCGRMLDDTAEHLCEEDYFDEEQYLDIDSLRSKELFEREQKVRATGGGCYSLPLPGYENAKIRIRSYMGYYEETGQAYVKDWRLLGLFQERGTENGD